MQTLQLEAKCFSQQEQLDCLQEQLETEREQAEAKQEALAKELALRVDQVHKSVRYKIWYRVHVAFVQVTKMYENVQKEKDELVGKVAATETEAKSVREQLTSSQETNTAAAKVSPCGEVATIQHDVSLIGE